MNSHWGKEKGQEIEQENKLNHVVSEKTRYDV